MNMSSGGWLAWSRASSNEVSTLRAAVLAIGSLYWREDERRNQWRAQRLLIDQSYVVCAPIRYGRLSLTRTYTMVFGENRQGQGLLVPCRTPILSIEDLVEEAEALWQAEDKNAETGQISSDWGGTVAVTFTQLTSVTHSLADQWARHFEAHGRVVSPVGMDGLLSIPGLRNPGSDGSGSIVILATATEAESPPPSPSVVAEAWIKHGHEDYFFQNVLSGIRTSDDLEIWAHMTASARRKDYESKFPDAVRELESGLQGGEAT